MAYRSFKRVLSETSLERKCRFLFGACLLLLITGSFWFYGQRTEGLVKKQNEITGRVLVEKIRLEHHWMKVFVEQGKADIQDSPPDVTLSEIAKDLATEVQLANQLAPSTTVAPATPAEQGNNAYRVARCGELARSPRLVPPETLARELRELECNTLAAAP